MKKSVLMGKVMSDVRRSVRKSDCLIGIKTNMHMLSENLNKYLSHRYFLTFIYSQSSLFVEKIFNNSVYLLPHT